MKLIVPYLGRLSEVDARLVGLAELLGVCTETLALPAATDSACLEKLLPSQGSCLVVNPRVIEEWVGLKGLPAALAAFSGSRFKHLLVHGLRVGPFDSALVAALSGGKLRSVEPAGKDCHAYVIAKDALNVCDAFSGLSFGPVNPANDHVFFLNGGGDGVRPLISIGGRPFMAALRLGAAEVVFVASEDLADLTTEVGGAPLAAYFSKIVPHAMALRYIAGDECWRPSAPHATIIIDDPLLRKTYGFLDFASLLRLTDQHNFHATIAFIPHNFRRHSARVIRMFQDNPGRLSICFHGNDHTNAELASTDPAFLNTMLHIAERRMQLFFEATGLPCDRVMVFPQGRFSLEVMKVLNTHDFSAAVNTRSHPVQQSVQLTIGELAQPAVLRYGGFPLFLRRPIRLTQSEDVAFNVFFGKPVLIVEHHDVFRRPESLMEIAGKINSVAPNVRWSNLATAASNSTLTRMTPAGEHHVRAYSGTVAVSNPSNSARTVSIEWSAPHDDVEQVLMNRKPCSGFVVDGDGIRLSADVEPCSSATFQLVHRKVGVGAGSLGFRWNAHAFIRRRLSEARDNYLSKNERVLTAAKSLQRLMN